MENVLTRLSFHFQNITILKSVQPIEITFGVFDLIAPLSDFKWDQKSFGFSVSWQFLNIVYLQMLLTYFNHVFITLLDFLVLAHCIRLFWILVKELKNPVKLFSKKSTVLTIPRFFGFLIHLNSLFNSKSFITTLWYDTTPWGEWSSRLRRCDQNRKVPSSNPTRCSPGLRDPTSLQGSWWPLGQICKMQVINIGWVRLPPQ